MRRPDAQEFRDASYDSVASGSGTPTHIRFLTCLIELARKIVSSLKLLLSIFGLQVVEHVI